MTEQHHNHTYHHEHDHHHSKLPIVCYIIGLIIAVVALFLGAGYQVLQNILFVVATILAGYHVVVLEGVGETVEQSKANQQFTPNSHILMGLAALGAFVIGSYWEGALLILIFSGAHFLEDYAEGRSRREITRLLEMNPTKARLIQSNGDVKEVNVSELTVGDKVQVLNGAQVPIDGVILSGLTAIDESSINGESIPKEKSAGDEVFGSTINGTGSFTMEVTTAPDDTVFSKILQLVNQNQNNQTKAASIIQRFEPKYVTGVIIVIMLVILIGPFLFGWTWSQSIYRGMVLLVAASPCALAASTVSATLSATSNLAKKGVLSKGSVYLSQLADLKAIAFDKTGTLTKGQPEVTNYYIFNQIEEDAIIDIVIALEKESNHPLAEAILRKFKPQNQITLSVENQIGVGLVGDYQGKEYRIGKPTSFEQVPEKVMQLNKEWANEGKTVVYIAEDKQVIGIIALMDVPSEHAKGTIEYFKQEKIYTRLITGDSEITGKAVASELGMDDVVADVMPEDKSTIIAELKDKYGISGMVGDGVNDAPALVNANVGIAMGEGTDVAVEVSDLVLMQNDLSKLVQAHRISSKMNRIIKQNIIFSMAVVVFLVIVSLLGLTDMAISVIIHEGSTLVVILNGLRLLGSE